jgi:hypothetical protein
VLGYARMSVSRTPLPSDFRDRPILQRWWMNVQILLRRRAVKVVCCESFRKGEYACKGCATLYDPNSAWWIYRMIARVAKKKLPEGS